MAARGFLRLRHNTAFLFLSAAQAHLDYVPVEGVNLRRRIIDNGVGN